MRSAFVDTGGWGNLLVSSEPLHTVATGIINGIRRRGDSLVTTNYVLAEVSALLIRPLRVPRVRRLELLTEIRRSTWVEIVHIDADTDAKSWRLLERFADKDFSLVDASSFVVMEQLGLRYALTGDRHFEQAGFTRLLKPAG